MSIDRLIFEQCSKEKRFNGNQKALNGNRDITILPGEFQWLNKAMKETVREHVCRSVSDIERVKLINEKLDQNTKCAIIYFFALLSFTLAMCYLLMKFVIFIL